jgi:hypothetical protein
MKKASLFVSSLVLVCSQMAVASGSGPTKIRCSDPLRSSALHTRSFLLSRETPKTYRLRVTVGSTDRELETFLVQGLVCGFSPRHPLLFECSAMASQYRGVEAEVGFLVRTDLQYGWNHETQAYEETIRFVVDPSGFLKQNGVDTPATAKFRSLLDCQVFH